MIFHSYVNVYQRLDFSHSEWITRIGSTKKQGFHRSGAVQCFSQSQWWITLARSANLVGFIPSFLLFFMIPIVGWIPIYVLGLNPCYEPYSQCWYFVIVPRGKKFPGSRKFDVSPHIFSVSNLTESIWGVFFQSPYDSTSEKFAGRVSTHRRKALCSAHDHLRMGSSIDWLTSSGSYPTLD